MTGKAKQKHILTRPKTERRGGQAGNKRGKERQRRRAELRASDPRVQRALAEREEADKRVRSVKGGHVPVGQYAGMTARILEGLRDAKVIVATPIPDQRGEEIDDRTRIQRSMRPAPLPAIDVPKVEPKAEGDDWELGQARSMLRQGYRIDHVIKVTGWGPDWFDDMPMDDDGYGLRLEDW